MIGESYADVSLFIRTMNTEIFDIAASDVTAVGEMVEIAEIMNKVIITQLFILYHYIIFAIV